MPLKGAAGRFTQRLDLVGEESAATIEQVRREEPASSRDKCTTIIGHAAGYQVPPAAQSSDCALQLYGLASRADAAQAGRSGHSPDRPHHRR
jgi:hypothetical protein